MSFSHYGLDFGHGFDGRHILVVDALDDGAGFHRMRGNRPLAIRINLEQQIDQAHMRAPEAGHHSGLALQRAAGHVDAVKAIIGGTGEDQVAVASENHVDALDACQVEGGVFHARHIFAGVDARMGEGDDDVGTRLANGRDPGFGGLDDVADHHLVGEVRGIPGQDLRRHEADDADLDGVLCTGAVDQFLFDDAVGLDIGIIGSGIFAELVAAHQIGADDRETGALQGTIEEFKAVIELVVAQRAGIVAEGIECCDGGVDVTLVKALFIGVVVAHRIALDQVTIVEQHRIAGLGADGFDDGGGARQAHRVVGGVGIVVIGQDGDVDIGRLDDTQMRLVRLGHDREGVHGDHGAHTGRADEEAAPGNRWQEVHRISPCENASAMGAALPWYPACRRFVRAGRTGAGSLMPNGGDAGMTTKREAMRILPCGQIVTTRPRGRRRLLHRPLPGGLPPHRAPARKPVTPAGNRRQDRAQPEPGQVRAEERGPLYCNWRM